MSILIFMRVLTDCALYLSIANFVAGYMFSGGDSSFLPIVILSFIPVISAFFRGKPQRYVPLLALVSLFFFIKTVPVAVMYLLLSGYIVMLVKTENYYTVIDYRDRMTKSLRFIFIVPALALISQTSQVYMQLCLIYLLTYLVGGVLLLRIARHNVDTLKSPRFLVLNTLFVGLWLGVCLFLSTPEAFKVLMDVMGGLYQNVIMPILMLFVYIAMGLAWLIERLINLWSGDGEAFTRLFEGDIGKADDTLDYIYQGEANPYLLAVLTVIGIAILVFLSIKLYRWLMRNSGKIKEVIGVAESREFISSSDAKPDRLSILTGDLRDKIRREYRKFLKLCEKSGAGYNGYDTTREVQSANRAFFDEAPMTELRESYIIARYSGHNPTKEQMEAAVDAVKRIKKG